MRFQKYVQFARIADVSSNESAARVLPDVLLSKRQGLLTSYAPLSSESSTLLPFHSEMRISRRDNSIFPSTIIQCGEDADLMNVLARLREGFVGLPSALATSSE